MPRAARVSGEDGVTLSHPDKVLFPDDGLTKRDLAGYYAQVAETLLPHLAGRPLTLERYPFGITAKGFIQKDTRRGAPDCRVSSREPSTGAWCAMPWPTARERWRGWRTRTPSRGTSGVHALRAWHVPTCA